MNDYYKAWAACNGGRWGYWGNLEGGCPFGTRGENAKKYAWAIPSDIAIASIAKLGKPIVEIGAGTGYWAHLLQEQGVEIFPYDRHVEDNPYGHDTHWTTVLPGSDEKISEHPDADLFLCWPPYDKAMAAECLERWLLGSGEHLIYIGESRGGCTADDRFWAVLEVTLERVESIDIPQWHGMHDYLTIYRRK